MTKKTEPTIQMNPDWPKLGTPEFNAKLAAWHQKHNSPEAIAARSDPDRPRITAAGRQAIQ